MDKRDERTWIAIELTKQGEQRVDDGSLERTLRDDLGVDDEFPVFVPAMTYSKGNKSITVHLIEGYVFVASGLPEVRYFALESKVYVNSIMSSHSGPHGMRVLGTIPDAQVQSMRTRLREQIAANIPAGSHVRILEGNHRNLEGTVIRTMGDQALVEIKLRSLITITGVPLVFLEAFEPEPEPKEDQNGDKLSEEEQDSKGRLTARNFYLEVLSIIGAMTGFEEGTFVPMEEVLPRVLRAKGLDPNNLPDGWILRGVKGIYRRVGYAFRNQREGYCKTPKTLQGDRRGMWGLTAEGARLAKLIHRGDK